MPITKLVVDNFMRVRHVDIDPGPGMNEVTGFNENGKSSLLNAIATMAGGRKPLSWKPINDDAEEATIVIHMDDVGEVPVRAVKTFKRNDAGELIETLVLEGPGGARFPKPQKTLDAIFGTFSFDPLAMLRMDADELRGVLEKFVPGFDFAADRLAYDDDFAKRTDVNRKFKELTAQVAGIMVPEGTPGQPIDEGELVAELQRVGEHNTNIETRKANRERLAAESLRHRETANGLVSRAAELRKQADDLDTQAAELRASADNNDRKLIEAGELPPLQDAGAVRAKIEAARGTNRAVADLTKRNGLIVHAERLDVESKALTKALDDRRAARAEAVKKAKMPVAGLSIDENGIVTFRGQPLDQASQAQKIRVSCALAAALSPRLKVALVRDGSLMDKKSWALLEQYAVEQGLQLFVETVDSSRPTAIVIEDGRVRGAEPKLEAAE